MAEGFLGRWSQRKQEARSGKPFADPEVQADPLASSNAAASNVASSLSTPKSMAQAQNDPSDQHSDKYAESVSNGKAEMPLPTLEDVKNLTSQSDYAPFVARNVPSEVRNTAMKKLFTDPHYNVMDKLDIYIDDYSKPDPISESMLRQMASAKFLNLFSDEESKTGTAPVTEASILSLGDDAHDARVQSMTQSARETIPSNSPPPSGMNDDHSDLRLQQNHATGLQKPGRSTE